MRIFYSILFILFLAVPFNEGIPANKIQYISPMPGSKYNSEQVSIILGYTDRINTGERNLSDIKVTGSLSGIHTGKIIFAESDAKLLFIPDRFFESGERVTVYLKKENYSFSFFIRSVKANEQDFYSVLDYPKTGKGEEPMSPDTMPNINVLINGPTASGNIFITNIWNFGGGYPSTLMILNNNGTPVFARDILRRAYDFKKQNDNLLTYYNEVRRKFHGINRYYQIVDSFWCQNGYSTDFHELQVMPNGDAWVMSYDPQWVDMSVIVPGGNTHALVKGLVIQKININKNVVFQWRSWDHFQITDATHENLLDDTIDYVHGNSIEVDTDGNIIISSRNMDEVTKISTATGNIIWRLGGKNNQFTFINDTIGFSHQHDARRISNGHLTLYDNGNFHTPHFSRAVEYQLNETTPKTATLVWSYRRTPSIYAFAMGNVQRLPNGNTIIGWGSSYVTLTEVTPSGQIMYELYLPVTMSSYRAFRYEWSPLTGGVPISNKTPNGYRLYQNYPNPFNPNTIIKFQIKDSRFVTLKVYNILGKEISTLLKERLNAGIYEAEFNASDLGSGVYYYRLEAGDFTDTKKMLLVK